MDCTAGACSTPAPSRTGITSSNSPKAGSLLCNAGQRRQPVCRNGTRPVL